MENTKQKDAAGCYRGGDEMYLEKKKYNLQMKSKIHFEKKSILHALA